MCFINSILSTSSGRDRLDVLYQLDFIGRDRLDVFYQLNLSTSSGKDRLNVFHRIVELASIPGRWEKDRV